jgi:hypothetical protein
MRRGGGNQMRSGGVGAAGAGMARSLRDQEGRARARTAKDDPCESAGRMGSPTAAEDAEAETARAQPRAALRSTPLRQSPEWPGQQACVQARGWQRGEQTRTSARRIARVCAARIGMDDQRTE